MSPAGRAHETAQQPTGSGDATPLSDEPVAADVLATPSEGLEARPQPPKRVVIIGAGLAGLVSGFELAR